MKKSKRFLCSILILTLLIYYVLGIYINNKIYAATTRQRVTSLEGLTNESYPGIASIINELKKAHPNWTFTILYTGLDWSTVIYNQTESLHGRSLVQNSSTEWVCSACGKTPYDSGSWYCASKATVAYYMDIRNWLNERYIFAFETLSYDETTQTIDGVKKILSGTFMDKENITYFDTEGNVQTIEKSYAQVIMEAAKEASVSPYHLASRVKQEQGNGTSGLVNGNYTYTDSEGNPCTDLVGYYNYFNIKAFGSGVATIIKNGLTHAKSKGWTTPELAIKGGASFLAAEYISNYQDCLYLEKYQVDSAGGLYYHQYMQNVSAPYTEGYSTYVAYRDMEMLDYSFNFIIPVYENMPEIVSPMPSAVPMDIVTENVKVTTAYSKLKIRQTASSSGSIIGYADKDAILLRIEKATVMSEDGRYWDKVVYDNGLELIIGYAARTDTDGSQYLTLVEDATTVNEEMLTITDVNLRNGPGTIGTRIKQTLSSDVKLTVIDKMQYQVNNYFWYRVKLEDGTQGYIVSEYLKSTDEETDTPEVPSEPEEPTEPENPTEPEQPIEPEIPSLPEEQEKIPENCMIEEDKLIIAPGTKITDLEGVTIEGEATGTGATVTLNNKNYILVVLGDVSGDGEVKSKDYMMIKNYIMGTLNLNDGEKKAADVSKDNEIKSKDYMIIKNYIMGLTSITF